MENTPFGPRYSAFTTLIEEGYSAQESVYGFWKEAASEMFRQSPNSVYFAMLRKKDGRADMAKRKIDALKAVDPDQAKLAKEDAKTFRQIVEDSAKKRGLDNYRMTWSRIVDDAGIMAGMIAPEKTGSKGGSTSYDKVAEALRTLRNHLMETEATQCLELKDAWAEFEEAAINDGILKDE